MMKIQVEPSHYEFLRYMDKRRWNSIWHQLDEVASLGVNRVLEIGPGPGVFKTLAASIGISVETVDIDPSLKPDHVASATSLPFADGAYEVVVGFQVLEHLPYEVSLRAFAEMSRVARRAVIISLPDAKSAWRYVVHLPKLGSVSFLVPRPRLKSPTHGFDGQHYWEVNKRDFPLRRIMQDFTAPAIGLVRSYRVAENPYHRFFVFHKNSPSQSSHSE